MSLETLPTVKISRRRRFGSLVRAEMTLLLRNRVALFYAIGVNPLLLVLISSNNAFWSGLASLPGFHAGPWLLAMLVVMGLSMTIYYNLTSASVARREAKVLIRLAAGQPGKGEVLAAIATPNILVFLAQIVLSVVAIWFMFGSMPMINPLVSLVGLVLGAIIFTELAYLTGVYTRTVEAAQLTVTPGFLLSMLISGVVVPIMVLPELLGRVLELLPVYPVVQLIFIGVGGDNFNGSSLDFVGTLTASAQPLAVLLVWCLLGGWLVKSKMRWTPRP